MNLSDVLLACLLVVIIIMIMTTIIFLYFYSDIPRENKTKHPHAPIIMTMGGNH